MPDFDERLTDLARYAETTGRLDPAADVRARSDQRRRRRTATVAGLGIAVAVALTAGIAIAQPLGGRPRPPAMVPAPWVSTLPPAPATTPPVVVTPPPASAGPSSAAFDHRRAYRLVPVVNGVAGPGALGVAKGGRVGVLDPGAVFTTATSAPGDDEWLLRVDERGGSQCVVVGSDNRTFGTGKCLPSNSAMRLRYHRVGTDRQGQPTYAIGLSLTVPGFGHERFLGRDPADGDRVALIDVPRAQATIWSFVDQGPSTLAR